ncbi:MAG: DinB family protein [Phycisphaeraceae bacterium]|nr:DinB family protein [Phycisphaeraceae bacterium]
MNPLKLYDYLVRSREKMFDAVRPLTFEQYGQRFDFALETIGATITHMMISEWYYLARFRGLPVPPYSQWPVQYENPATFEVVEKNWQAQQREVRGVIGSERDWTRRIEYDSFADDAGKRWHIGATAGDVLTQLALHEVHHRSQLMVMLRLLGARPLQDIDYNELMYERREIT